MSRLTGIIIARNEEERIADCIDSIYFCDEIILIDNGSSDNTIEIAERMGAKSVKYIGSNFSEMRTKGLNKARGSWVLYIDADEIISKELAENIKKIILERDEIDEVSVYKLKRKNFYLGKHEWPHIERLERLFFKNTLRGWQGRVHESPIYKGEVGELDGYLLHYTHRNLSEMLAKTIEWSEIEARLRLEAGHPKVVWWRFPRVMITSFVDSYVKQKGYKVGIIGLIESMYQAFSMFITYARLWEMSREAGSRSGRQNVRSTS